MTVVDEGVAGQSGDEQEEQEDEQQEVTLTPDQLKAAEYLTLWVAPGFVKPDGDKDGARVREKLFEMVAPAIVGSLKERADKAIGRSRFVEGVWSDLPTPDSFNEQPDPLLAEYLWRKADQFIWGALKAAHDGQVQALVTERMGGYFLCHHVLRTTNKRNKGYETSVYLTRDLKCLLEDWVTPFSKKARTAAAALAANLAFATESVPEYADKLDRTYKDGMKLALQSGEAILAPALVAARATEPDSE